MDNGAVVCSRQLGKRHVDQLVVGCFDRRVRTLDLLGKYLNLVSGLGSDERVGELQLGAGTRHLGGVEMLKQIGDGAVPAGMR